MSRRLIPVTRAARIGLATAASSRAVLGASFTWLALLVGVYAADAGPPLPAMATTAAVLFPIAAWAAAAHLAATSDDLRAVLTAATGRPVALLLDAVPPLIWLIGAAVTGVAAAALFDPHPAPPVHWLLGVALHLLSGLVGVALALSLQALRQTRGGQSLTILAAALASALVPFLPPIRPLLQAWSAADHPAGTALEVWSLLGPVVLTAVLTALAGLLRRRRP